MCRFWTKILVVLLLVAMVVVVPSNGNANSIDIGSIGDMALKYSRVAVIRIVERRSAILKVEDQEYACGWLIRASVVENFKGGSGDFEFFTHAEEGYMGSGRPYLVMTMNREDANVRSEIALENSGLQTEPPIDCRDWHRQHFEWIFYPANTLFPFDPVAQKLFDGRWIYHVPTVGYSISIDSNYPMRTKMVPAGENQNYNYRYEVLNWQDVVAEINAKIGAQR